VATDYIAGGGDINNGQNLMVLSFSLALIGFMSGMAMHSRAPMEFKGANGQPTILAASTFAAAFLILLCLAMIVIAPEFFAPPNYRLG
jgi:hypothetical protein